jgi:hypothetical protein
LTGESHSDATDANASPAGTDGITWDDPAAMVRAFTTAAQVLGL